MDFMDIIMLTGGQTALQCQLGKPDDGIKRGSYFMTHVGQKLRFGNATCLSCLLCSQKLLCNPSLLGNIFLNGDKMGDHPLFILDRRNRGMFPEYLTIFSLITEIAAPFLTGQDGTP